MDKNFSSAVLVLTILTLVLFIYNLQDGRLSVNEQTTTTIAATETHPSYKFVAQKPIGWFKTGQKADIVLYATGFDESGGSLILNHPAKIAVYGEKLAVSDTYNNRVLIWTTIPTKNNEPPDLVLGQRDFNSNIGKLGKDGMNWPMGVSTDGKRLLVADAGNDRVLIWNSFPTTNGQPADLVLGASDFDSWPTYTEWKTQRQPDVRDPKRRIYWPWDVWTDGEKIVVTSTTDSSVMVWNKFPTENNQPADIILGQLNSSMRFRDKNEITGWPIPFVTMETPRSIASDGKYLAVGMYGDGKMYVWNDFPKKDGEPADFIAYLHRLPGENYAMVAGLAIKDNKLFAATSHQVFVWNNLPTTKISEDFRVGNLNQGLDNGSMRAPEGVASDGQRLFVADTYNNRVLIFNKIPAEPGANAYVILGQPDFGINIFSSDNSFSNPSPFSDGNHLFVSSDFDNKIAIYNDLPDESGAEADIVITNLGGAELGGVDQITSDGEKMIAANREANRILIWNKIPYANGQLPDIILGASTDLKQWKNGNGMTGFNNPMGVTTDGKRLFAADSGNNRLLVWNEMPSKNQTVPDIVLGQPDFDSTASGSGLSQFNTPRQISTDGKRLVVADEGNRRVLVWKKIPARNGEPADFEIKFVNHSLSVGDMLPTDQLGMVSGVFVYNNSLFVADTGNNRVLVWSKFPDSGSDEPDIVIGQPDFVSQYRTNSNDVLFMPSSISFDGNFLWVGEFKFSNRLLRFGVGNG